MTKFIDNKTLTGLIKAVTAKHEHLTSKPPDEDKAIEADMEIGRLMTPEVTDALVSTYRQFQRLAQEEINFVQAFDEFKPVLTRVMKINDHLREIGDGPGGQ